MKRRHVRRQTWWLLTALAIMVALAVIVLSAPREVRRRRVEAAIARFQASPSQSAADELALLLAAGIPTCRQGERILSLVLSPAVTTRRAYPPHRVATVNIECPFHLTPPRTNDRYFTQGTLQSRIQMEGQETTRARGGVYEGLAYGPWFVGCETPPLAVGTHRGQIHIDCTLVRREFYAPVWKRLKSLVHGHRQIGGMLRQIRSYAAHLEIPLEITVVEAADAEQVALMSDPRLDAAVRQSFTCERKSGRAFSHPLVGHSEMILLRWMKVPIAVAFGPVLRLSDGREVHWRSRHILHIGQFRIRAGNSGYLTTSCADFMIQSTPRIEGYHEAKIILKPDPNFAYEDPAIKAIWGGTLEFPISFSVYEEPQSQ